MYSYNRENGVKVGGDREDTYSQFKDVMTDNYTREGGDRSLCALHLIQ